MHSITDHSPDIVIKCVRKDGEDSKYMVQIKRLEPRIVRDASEKITPEMVGRSGQQCPDCRGQAERKIGLLRMGQRSLAVYQRFLCWPVLFSKEG